MTVQEIDSIETFNNILSSNSNKLIVIDFNASWCGPCQYIKPLFHKLAEENSDVIFLSVDVDELDELASERGISAMPTFQFVKNGQQLEELRGASIDHLKELVKKYK